MVTRQTRAVKPQRDEGQVIPFRRSGNLLQSGELLVAAGTPHARSRTLRPTDAILLLPIIAPITAAILLGLLGWFVAWLAIVGTLVTAIVVADLARAIQWRLYGATIQPFDPHAISGR
jgi:hypothetical protein